MKVRMKAVDVVTILSEVSRAKKSMVYTKYGLNASITNAITRACQQGRWKLV